VIATITLTLPIRLLLVLRIRHPITGQLTLGRPHRLIPSLTVTRSRIGVTRPIRVPNRRAVPHTDRVIPVVVGFAVAGACVGVVEGAGDGGAVDDAGRVVPVVAAVAVAGGGARVYAVGVGQPDAHQVAQLGRVVPVETGVAVAGCGAVGGAGGVGLPGAVYCGADALGVVPRVSGCAAADCRAEVTAITIRNITALYIALTHIGIPSIPTHTTTSRNTHSPTGIINPRTINITLPRRAIPRIPTHTHTATTIRRIGRDRIINAVTLQHTAATTPRIPRLTVTARRAGIPIGVADRRAVDVAGEARLVPVVVVLAGAAVGGGVGVVCVGDPAAVEDAGAAVVVGARVAGCGGGDAEAGASARAGGGGPGVAAGAGAGGQAGAAEGEGDAAAVDLAAQKGGAPVEAR
jgi:hypothetical protein